MHLFPSTGITLTGLASKLRNKVKTLFNNKIKEERKEKKREIDPPGDLVGSCHCILQLTT